MDTGITTYADARAWLRTQGIETEPASWGLSGTLTFGTQSHSFQIGKSSGGGSEMSVKSAPDPRSWWFWSGTLEGLARLMVEARTRVVDGRAASWLDALRELDSTMDWLWPKEG